MDDTAVLIAVSVPTGTTIPGGQPDICTTVYEVPAGALADVLNALEPHRKATSR
jgi:hypothetical protein